ncbi:hypothetical protein BDZ89DRAFT_411266 [Hymenopellis radicata]|nr:hypothetical protein BDZ89DRAFT_411266 [Hymenopellis radicata]
MVTLRTACWIWTVARLYSETRDPDSQPGSSPHHNSAPIFSLACAAFDGKMFYIERSQARQTLYPPSVFFAPCSRLRRWRVQVLFRTATAANHHDLIHYLRRAQITNRSPDSSLFRQASAKTKLPLV